MEPKLSQFLTDLSQQLSTMLAVLGCAIFAVVRWARHPKVSAVVLLALIVLLLQIFVFAAVFTWVPDWFIKSATPADTEAVTRNVYLVLGIMSNVVIGVVFVLLLAAIFMDRKPVAI